MSLESILETGRDARKGTLSREMSAAGVQFKPCISPALLGSRIEASREDNADLKSQTTTERAVDFVQRTLAKYTLDDKNNEIV